MREITRDVPAPPEDDPDSGAKYPFRSMEIGDSFVEPHFPHGNPASARSAANHHGRKYGKRFRSRTEDKNPENNYISGVRIWRVE